MIYMAVVLLCYTAFFAISFFHLLRIRHLDESMAYEEMLNLSYTRPVSILVPAYNEEAGIYGSVRSLLGIEYPEFEIIVINDGSKDGTLQTMIEGFRMEPVHRAVRMRLQTEKVRAVYRSALYDNLYLIDKDNGGKADALNAGINYGSYPYFCSLDGDSVLERHSFLKVMKPILESGEEVIASGGSIRIANGCKIESGEVVEVGLSNRPLVVMQVIEYLRAFLLGRIGMSRHNLLLIISGAFGVFNKHWVIEAGGYRRHTVGEDMELIIRLHRLNKDRKLNKQIIYVPDPVCWTEAPESATYLRRQRNRWHRGLLESLLLHKSMLFNPKYGMVGWFSLPYFLFVELLGPIVEALAYVVLVVTLFISEVYWEFTALLLLLALLYGSMFSMGAVLMEEWSLRKYPKVRDLLRLFLYAVTESFWYRPLTVWWRCEGLFQWAVGRRGWGDMKRKGVSS
ncbi:glycosyltransferase family 2 protein [Cohnella candidum]|uniref:Glycosyltransferase family 2 protein n=1 Tax=Cohnella candidum TaxID=2674991 RepID=A0A3G3K527_9BACL|nr:glycosyltransferase [Cohnella candidum]AYQ75564.1 glycosyltransferase family 2 protein [Cohnella candidum]